jgi:epidermal growth factor receptor substrate 15
MKHFYTVFVFLMLNLLGFSQLMVQLDCRTISYKTNKKESGVTVNVYEGSKLIKSTTTTTNGSSIFEIPSGKIYTVEFAKAGKVSRNIKVNTKDIVAELLPAATTPFMEVQVSLFDEIENADFSYVKNNPITEFYFDGKSPQLKYDEVLAKKMSKKIEAIFDELLKEEAKKEAQYQAAIKAADNFYTQKKYAEALTKYEEAVSIKPKEKHPNDRIIEIDKILQGEKQSNLANQQLEQEYQNLIKAADMLRDLKKYQPAIDKYNEAIAKKNEKYPNDQIAILKSLLEKDKKEEELNEKYNKAISSADNLFDKENFAEAKAKYLEASNLKPLEAYPKKRLTEIEAKLKDQQANLAKKKQYDDAILAGDQFFKAQKWNEAKAKYNDAIKIDATQNYPKDKIKEIDKKLSDLENEKNKQQQITKLIADGNAAMSNQQWDNAKAKFNEVLKLDDENYTAKEKLAEISAKEKEMKNVAEQNAKFQKLVSEGDNLANAQKNNEALAKYQEAIGIKTDAAVQKKINDLKTLIDKNNLAAENEAKYKEAIASGDGLFSKENYSDAKEKYTQALKFKPTEEYPKKKLAEIETKLKEKQAEGTKKKQYDDFIALADQLFKAEKWSDAKIKYNDAIKVDGTQNYPKDKIKEIDKKLEALEKEKANQAEISKLISEGNTSMASKQWSVAKGKFNDVLKLDANNTIAKSKLLEIQEKENELKSQTEKEESFKKLVLEGDNLSKSKNLPEAVSKYEQALVIKKDASVEKKINDLKNQIEQNKANEGKQAQYDAAMKEGETLFSAKKWEEAKAKFNLALSFDAKQNLPKERIKAIDAKIAEENANQSQIDAKYNAAMKKGDEAFKTEKYLEAIKLYNEALSIKPNEKEPVSKAAEAERLEREKSTESDKQYQKILDVGQKAIGEKDYKKAKEMYNRAISLKPNDNFPKNKLKEIDNLIKEEEEANKRSGEIEANYKAKMMEAESLASKKDYDNAISAFLNASSIKPKEELPRTRIEELKQLRAKENDSAKQESMYQTNMKNGNTSILAKNYQKALMDFEKALSIKPGDKAAQDKISEVNQILANLSTANDEKKLKAEFDAYIREADRIYAQKDWLEAKKIYEKGLALIPSDSYANKQVEKCVNNAKSVNDGEREYQKIITKADENFAAANYIRAIELYERALSLKSYDSYPKQKLKEIDGILNPVVIQTGPLNSLGTPTDNSIIEAEKALKKAELERQGRKETKLNSVSNSISDESSRTQSNKTAEIYDNVDRIKQSEKEISELPTNYSEENKRIVKGIQQESQFIERKNKESANFKYQESLMNTDRVATIRKENEITYNSSESIYADNSDKLKVYNFKIQDQLRNDVLKIENRKVDDQVLLTRTQLIIEDKAIDDTEFRRVNELKMVEAKAGTKRVNDAYHADKTAKINTQTSEIETAKTNQSDKTIEDAKLAGQNKEAVKIAEKELVESDLNYSKKSTSVSLSADGEIAKTNVQISNSTIGMDENRIGAIEDLKIESKNLENRNTTKFDVNAKKSLDNQSEIYTEAKIIPDAVKKEKVTSAKNISGVIDTEKNVSEKSRSKSEEMLEYSLLVDTKIARTNIEISKSTIGMDINRVNAIEELKNEKKEREEKNREEFNSNLLKALSNQEEYQIQAKKIPVAVELEKETKSKNIAGITDADKKVSQSNSSTSLSDEEERLQYKTNLTKIEGNIEKEVAQKGEIAPQNADKMNRVSNQISVDNVSQIDQNTSKSYDAKKLIEDFDINKLKFDDKVANSLGSLYPEGVSQESFNQNGEDGLLVAVVTRRIVVKNGYGQIYTRTQTTNGITYSKNGEPSTEYTWQKETNDGKLQKHF